MVIIAIHTLPRYGYLPTQQLGGIYPWLFHQVLPVTLVLCVREQLDVFKNSTSIPLCFAWVWGFHLLLQHDTYGTYMLLYVKLF